MKRTGTARLFFPLLIVSAANLLSSCGQEQPQLPLEESVAPVRVAGTVETAHPDLYAVWGTSPSDLIATGSAGMTLHYDGEKLSYHKCATRLDLVDIWGVSTGDVYAISQSEIFHFDGSDWKRVHTETGAVLHSIRGMSADNIYAVGDDGVVLHYDGDGWTRISLRPYALRSVFGPAPDDVYAVGVTAGYFHYNGTRWRFHQIFDDVHAFTNVWASAPDDIYLAGADGVYRYDGSTTEQIFSGNCIDFVGRSPNDLYVMTAPYLGNVYHFDGTGWEVTSAYSGGWRYSNFLAMAATDEGHLASASTMGEISSFDGTGWSVINERSDNWFLDLYGLEDGTLYAAGDYDVWVYDGTAWKSMQQARRLNLRAIWASAPDDVWGVGPPDAWGEGIVRHFNGSDWSYEVIGGSTYREIWGLSSDDIYLASGSDLVHYDGAEWSKLDVDGYFSGVWGNGADNIYAVGDQGVIRHFDGNDWNRVPNASDKTLTDVWGGASGDFFAVGAYGTIVRISGEKATLEPSGTGAHLYAVAGAPTGELCAVGTGGTVLLCDGDGWFPVEIDIGWHLLGVWYIGNTIFIGGVDGLLLRVIPE